MVAEHGRLRQRRQEEGQQSQLAGRRQRRRNLRRPVRRSCAGRHRRRARVRLEQPPSDVVPQPAQPTEFRLVGHDGRAAVCRPLSRLHQEAETASSLFAVRFGRRQLHGSRRRRRRPGRRAVTERRSPGPVGGRRVDGTTTVRRRRRPPALPPQCPRRLRLHRGPTTIQHAVRLRSRLRRPQAQRYQRTASGEDAGQIRGIGRPGQLGA